MMPTYGPYYFGANVPGGMSVGGVATPTTEMGGNAKSQANAPTFQLAQQTTGLMDALSQGFRAGNPMNAVTTNPMAQTALTLGAKLAGPFGMPVAMAQTAGRGLGSLTGLMSYLGVNPNPNESVGIKGSSFGPNDLNGDITAGQSATAANAYGGMSFAGQVAAIAAALGLSSARGDEGETGPPGPGEGNGPGPGVGSSGAGSSPDTDTGGLLATKHFPKTRDGHVMAKALETEYVVNPKATKLHRSLLDAINSGATRSQLAGMLKGVVRG